MNDEKNNGRLALDMHRAVLENSGLKNLLVIQKTADQSPQIDFCQEAEDRGVDVLYIGESSFVEVSNPDNYLYWAFSAMKRLVVGRMANYVANNAKCKVVVVPDPAPTEPVPPNMVAVDGAAPVTQEPPAGHHGTSISRANSYKGQILPGLFVDAPSDDDFNSNAGSDSDPDGERDVVKFEEDLDVAHTEPVLVHEEDAASESLSRTDLVSVPLAGPARSL